MAELMDMTQVVMTGIKENGINAGLNRDVIIAHISPEMIDRETQMRSTAMDEVAAANKAVADGLLTETQRDIIVNSAFGALQRQSDFNTRLLARRR